MELEMREFCLVQRLFHRYCRPSDSYIARGFIEGAASWSPALGCLHGSMHTPSRGSFGCSALISCPAMTATIGLCAFVTLVHATLPVAISSLIVQVGARRVSLSPGREEREPLAR
jgi:hypothetical protein